MEFKKICFVVDSFFPDTNAGTEQYVLWLSKYLSTKNYIVSVLTPAVYKKHFHVYDGIPVYHFLVPEKTTTKELHGLIRPNGIENFVEELKKINPNIVHFHSYTRAVNSFHLKITKDLGFKTVFTPHLGNIFCIKGNFLLYENRICDGKIKAQRCLSCYIHSKLPQKKVTYCIISYPIALVINLLFKFRLKICLPPTWNIVNFKKKELENTKNYSDAITAIAPWISNVFKLNGINKISLVKQGIKQIESQHKITREQKKPIKLIFVGRLHYMKGLHLLLDALDSVDKKAFILKIVCIPFEQIYREKMLLKSNSLGMVEWCENLDRNEVIHEINNSDILVLPSISHEMAPLVILEAFACGKPVIGSTYPAITDMVTHNLNGLIFENNNIKSLSTILLRLISETNLLRDLTSNIKTPRTFSDVGIEMELIYNSLR